MTVAAVNVEPDLEAEIALAQAEILDGRGADAVRRLQAIADIPVYDAALYYWLSAALGAAGDHAAQASALKDAQVYHALKVIEGAGGDLGRLVREPRYAAQVGTQLYNAKLMGPASAAFAQAAAEPSREVLLTWALSLQHQGRMEEAVAVFSAAFQLDPTPQTHGFLLYANFFREDGVRRHAAEARCWAEWHTAPLDPAKRFGNPPLAGRPLRIGYVAPAFRGNQLRQFVLPVLENHGEGVEVFLYCRSPEGEAGVPAAAVRGIGHLSDEHAAALIAEDGIDVLVDLWGHAAFGRPGIFALKPAPVQAAWINYVQTTGLPTMDYVIHSDDLDTPEDEALFVEKIWKLGPIIAPFRPDERAQPSPTPALANGYVTFGSFNHPAKLSDETVAAWARILNGRPGSRLLLKYGQFADPVLQWSLRARFAAHAVDPERLDFQGHSTGDEYRASFAQIDLALDPSPATGGTTSSEAVANGVPLLTRNGPDFYSRLSTLRLKPLGLDHLIADSWDDYVARALELTEDLQALNELRGSMRARFDGSMLRDEAGFTRRLEAAFAEMFGIWERSRPAA